MNKYENDRIAQAIIERNWKSVFLDNRLMVNGGSNIDDINVDYDAFSNLSNLCSMAKGVKYDI